MNTILGFFLIYGGLLCAFTLCFWMRDQREKKRNDERWKMAGLQPPAKAPDPTGAWAAVGLGFAILIGAGLADGRKSAARPNANTSPPSLSRQSSPAIAAVAVSPRPTLESLRIWYEALDARKKSLAPGDVAAVASFNAEAAQYAAATNAFLVERDNVSAMDTPLVSGPSSASGTIFVTPQATGEHYVSQYFRRDGTLVPGHYQTNADGTISDNYSAAGNVNPHTGRVGSVLPPGSTSSRVSRK